MESLDLAGLEPFARGGCRLIYPDPRDPRCCIKVPVGGGGEAAERRSAAGWLRWVHRRDYYDENHRQWREHRRYARRFRGSWPAHLAACHGFVRTAAGAGLVMERVANADGSAGLNLREHVRKHGYDRGVRAALKDLRRFLLAHRVLLRDATAENIVLSRRSDGSLCAVIIDGLGNSEFIPVSHWIAPLGIRKVRSRWRIILRNVRSISRSARRGEGSPERPAGVRKGLLGG